MTIFYLSILLLLILYLVFEYISLQSCINKIPLRILINGTRGKSTTVKIIHSILQTSGKKVIAKTTGDLPLLIFPDGSQKEIKRSSPASIIENVRILKQAAKEKPDAVVMECMALQPETQDVLSRNIFKPNFTLITNILFDHPEVMGTDITETAWTISRSFLKDSSIILTEDSMELLTGLPFCHTKIQQAEKDEFPMHFENIPQNLINENWSLISELCTELNIDKKTAEKCFAEAWKSIDDSIKISLPNQKIEILNIFSINDIKTSESFINRSLAGSSGSKKVLFYLNCRADRPLRTREFVNFISNKSDAAEIWLTGDGKHLANNLFRNYKKNVKLISDQQAVRNINEGFSQETLVFLLGNFKDMENFISEMNSFTENQNEVQSI